MSKQLLCGNSSDNLVNAVAAPATRTVRLVTRLHVGMRRPAAAAYSVVGVRADGREALIALTGSRAVAFSRLHDEAGAYSAIRVRHWVGRFCAGRWETIAVRRQSARLPRRRACA